MNVRKNNLMNKIDKFPRCKHIKNALYKKIIEDSFDEWDCTTSKTILADGFISESNCLCGSSIYWFGSNGCLFSIHLEQEYLDRIISEDEINNSVTKEADVEAFLDGEYDGF